VSDITWTNDTRRLQDLVPWEHNPKRMTRKQADGLRLSIERFGFAVPFLVSPDGDIYDGHQRQTLMGAIREYGPSATVDVRVSSRQLTDDERRELVVRLKQNQAGWDFDMLANEWDADKLLEWGFSEDDLLGLDYEHTRLKETTESVKARSMFRVLISVPVDYAIDIRETLDALADVEGIEIDYGANN
jgi:hypothetical protein